MKKRTRLIIMALLLAMTAASVLVFANTTRIPTQGTTTIVPNSLVINWDDDSREPITIDTFRFFGFNVAQLRTMVGALDGTISTNADGTFQIMPSGSSVGFSPVTFNVETEIDYIVNQTNIRNHAGTLVSPNQPGWVFLTRYEYNWASVRDVIDALNLTLVDVTDDPETGITEVTVARPLPPDQQPTERPPSGPAARPPDSRGRYWSGHGPFPTPITTPGALTPTPTTSPGGLDVTPSPGPGTPMPSPGPETPGLGTPMPTPLLTGYGSISGFVMDVSSLTGIPQAGVTLHTSVNSPPLAHHSTTTSALGVYSIGDIPAGWYYVHINAEDFVPEFIPVLVQPGTTTFAPTLRAFQEDEDRSGTISGFILNDQITPQQGNSSTDLTLFKITDPVTLEFREGFTSQGSIVETITITNGEFQVALPYGNYNVTARANGFHTSQIFVTSSARDGSNVRTGDITMAPDNLTGEAFRIELTFNTLATHFILDPHLRGPHPNGGMHLSPLTGRSASIGNRRVAYMNNVALAGRSGGGTIRIEEFLNGRYDYYVHNHTNQIMTNCQNLRMSNATVRVFNENNQLIATFHVPSTGGPSVVWHVFSIEVSNGQRTLIPVNTMHNGPIRHRDVGN